MISQPRHYGLRIQLLTLICFIFVCMAAGGLGGFVTTPRIPGWYAQLAKPEWTPPNWVFGPVWTLLYLMMAVAGWLVWRQRGIGRAKLSFGLFAVQLALNSAWTILFFGLRNPGAALVDIIMLWLAILATLVMFFRYSRWAGILLVPYLAWVSFAAVLNLVIWHANL
jgi:benzodiazapine receptor